MRMKIEDTAAIEFKPFSLNIFFFYHDHGVPASNGISGVQGQFKL